MPACKPGTILGHRIDGTQAEFVRIPHADTSLYPIPAGADEEALVMLLDILPTGFEFEVLNGNVQPGSSVAIVGSGPIGLAALLRAQLYSPSQVIMIDLEDNRLAVAKRFGATDTVNSKGGDVAKQVIALKGGRGVDTAIEAGGIPATFNVVAVGGTIANVGAHGSKVDLHLERLWSHNVMITTRVVDTVLIPILLDTVQSKHIDASKLMPQGFPCDHLMISAMFIVSAFALPAFARIELVHAVLPLRGRDRPHRCRTTGRLRCHHPHEPRCRGARTGSPGGSQSRGPRGREHQVSRN